MSYIPKKRICRAVLPKFEYDIALDETAFTGESISEIRQKINNHLAKEFQSIINGLIAKCPIDISIQIDKKTVVLPIRYNVGTAPTSNILGSIHSQMQNSGPAVKLPKVTGKKFQAIRKCIVERSALWKASTIDQAFPREFAGKLIERRLATDEEFVDTWIEGKGIVLYDCNEVDSWKNWIKAPLKHEIERLLSEGKITEAKKQFTREFVKGDLYVLSLTDVSHKMFLQMEEEERVMKKCF